MMVQLLELVWERMSGNKLDIAWDKPLGHRKVPQLDMAWDNTWVCMRVPE